MPRPVSAHGSRTPITIYARNASTNGNPRFRVRVQLLLLLCSSCHILLFIYVIKYSYVSLFINLKFDQI